MIRDHYRLDVEYYSKRESSGVANVVCIGTGSRKPSFPHLRILCQNDYEKGISPRNNVASNWCLYRPGKKGSSV